MTTGNTLKTITSRFSTASLQLVGAFVFIILMTTSLGIFSISKVQSISSNLAVVNDVNSVKQRYAINFRGSVHDRAISLRDVSLVETSEELRGSIDEINALASSYEQSAALLDEMFAEPSGATDTERQILSSIKQTEAKTLPLIEKVVELKLDNEPAEAKEILMTQARPLFTQWLGQINEFIDHQESLNQSLGVETRKTADGFRWIMTVLVVVSACIGLLVARWVVTKVVRRSELIAEAATVFERESSESLAVFNDSLQSLQDASNKLKTSSESSLDKSNRVTNGTRVTKENVDTISVATEKMSASISSIETSAGDASNTSRECSVSARQSQAGLEALREAFGEIDDVVQNISSIAGQTNLLALNASIEAARAGEAGRGFAVVANEVQDLASKTHEMTAAIFDKVREIKSTSSETIEMVSQVTERIVSVDEKTSLAASSVAEQSGATSEIRDSVRSLSNSTEELMMEVKAIRQSSEQVAEVSKSVRLASNGIDQRSSELKKSIDRLLAAVR